jgi:protein involved in polysaccharide export with SLBB domain
VELQNELATLYKPQLQDNEVLVTLESRAVPVVVSGAVQKPGKIVFERPVTVREAIMEAGGFTPEADLKKVSLIRIVKGERKTTDLRRRIVPPKNHYVQVRGSLRYGHDSRGMSDAGARRKSVNFSPLSQNSDIL